MQEKIRAVENKRRELMEANAAVAEAARLKAEAEAAEIAKYITETLDGFTEEELLMGNGTSATRMLPYGETLTREFAEKVKSTLVADAHFGQTRLTKTGLKVNWSAEPVVAVRKPHAKRNKAEATEAAPEVANS
jgi:hypothetical protein